MGSVDFTIVHTLTPYLSTDTLNCIMICFLLAPSAKTAQLGLHTLLLFAMSPPTPVSPLLHAATLVTAGVFVLLRSTPILDYAPNVLFFIILIGGLTSVLRD